MATLNNERKADQSLAERATANVLQMLRFLHEWVNLGRDPIWDIYRDPRVLWQFNPYDWEGLPGLTLNIVEQGEVSWLKLQRLDKSLPPSLAEPLVQWIDVHDDPTRSPTLKSDIANPDHKLGEALPILFAEDFPHLQVLFERYVTTAWQPWAEKERPVRKSIELYHELFELKHKLDKPGGADSHELLCGIGMAGWDSESSALRVPLLLQAVEFAEIGEDFAIRILPRALSMRSNLDALYAIRPEQTKAFDDAFKNWVAAHPEPASPFELEAVKPLLRRAAAEIDASGSFVDDDAQAQSTDHLTVSSRWVFLLQRRMSNYVLDDVRKLAEKVEKDGVAGGAIIDMAVEMPQSEDPDVLIFRGVSTPGIESANGEVQELYFPKPFNREQLQVVRLLEHGDGVVLQGPPGTGKTHTIANIICHFLATGKRVLVTSKDAPALRVLRSQLPEHIQNLTASILSSERDGLRELEHSMQRITTDVLQLPRDECKRDIAQLETIINQLHQELAQIDRDLSVWAAKNINKVPAHLGDLQPHALALEVLHASDKYQWFDDHLDAPAGWETSDITAEFFELLRSARKEVGDDLLLASQPTVDPKSFPSVEDIAVLHRQLIRVQEITEELDHLRAVKPYPIQSQEQYDAARAACECLKGASDMLRHLHRDSWIRDVVLHLNFPDRAPLSLNSEAVRLHIDRFINGFEELHAIRGELAIYSVTGHRDAFNDAEFAAAVARGATCSAPIAASLRLFKKPLTARLAQIRVNGEPVQGMDGWSVVHRQIQLERQARRLGREWNTFASQINAPGVDADSLLSVEQLGGLLASLQQGWQYDSKRHSECNRHLMLRFSDPPQLAVAALLDQPADFLEPFVRGIALEMALFEQNTANAKREKLRQFVRTLPPYLSDRAVKFEQNWLAFGDTPADEIAAEWSDIVELARKLWRKRNAFSVISEAKARLGKVGARGLAQRIGVSVRDAESPTDGALPDDVMGAWLWASQGAFLRHIDARAAVQKLDARRSACEKRLAKSYETIVAKRTWLLLNEQLKRETSVVQQLQGFMHQLNLIGAGTGAGAAHHRRLAQQHMRKAHNAVRCWIMPQWRISETLPAELGLFDLVIIDEASQSDLLALPAIMRGKKMLVVGDDKQVSPSAIGTTTTAAEALYHRYLSDLPFGAAMNIKSSIYDLASVAFAGRMVRLREHFRCSEPIIRFCSRNFYNDEIRCLRVPTADERLLPTLIDIFVSHGERHAQRKINRAEADEIVSGIKRLTADPLYNGRSIGVVSLLGNEQPRLIFKLLQEAIGEEIIVKHNIRCGDAAAFQGSEFDIVFLSMVSSGRPPALSSRVFEQRFNVAVSRARDRAYLVRSVRPEDLSPRDLRFKLIQHFRDPGLSARGKGRELCESEFEEGIYDALTLHGYKLLPQVPASGFRIDLVVEDDLGHRLAVECDGAQYHQPHQWLEDINRQRVLERTGWKFHRIWGPAYYRDKDATVQELILALQANDVAKSNAEAADLSGLTEYREVRLESDGLQTEVDLLTIPLDHDEQVTDEQEALAAAIPVPDHPAAPAAISVLSTPTQRQIQVGDTVEYLLQGNDSELFRYTIVESASNPDLGLINYQTPIARALLDHLTGDTVVVKLPEGEMGLKIGAISASLDATK